MTLRQQLDLSAQHDAEYGNKLSSHLPMALTALARLGADDSRLAEFASRYAKAKRLHPAPPVEPWPSGEAWQSRLGDPRAWPAYRSFFNEWIEQEGSPYVLELTLPVLLRGVGASAFHGLIRTAYAVAAGHSHELSDALAYWACRWFSLGPLGMVGKELEVKVVLGQLTPRPAPQPLIAERMLHASMQPGFALEAARLRIDGDKTLAQLALQAAQLYAATRNFTVLHLQTSAHAMRLLLMWLDDELHGEALSSYWLNYAAGFASAGLRPGVDQVTPSADARSWATIVSLAVTSDDDHVIKVVDSCREQEKFYGGDVWRQAAARAV